MDVTEFLQKLAEQGVLALIIILFVTGHLLPKAAVDRMVTGKDKELETKDAVIERQDKVIERQSALIERMAERSEK